MKTQTTEYLRCAGNKARSDERGSVIVLVLVIALFLAFLGAAALFSAFYENENAVRRTKRTMAEATARAGIEQVIYWFNTADKSPGSIADQTGRTDWAYNYLFVHRGEDGYNDNDANSFFSSGDTLKTVTDDKEWYDFNGNGQYEKVVGLMRNPGAWQPDVEVPWMDRPTFPNGHIERLMIYAPPPAVNPKIRARATILCVAISGDPGDEPYVDKNTNGQWDSGEPFRDVNGNGRWDASSRHEPFVDLNNNGRWDSGETFTDLNSNGVWDQDTEARVIMRCIVKEFRPFSIILGGVNVHDLAQFSAQSNMHWGDFFILDGEPYMDYNMNGKFDSATESYIDINSNGVFNSQNTGGDIDFGTLNIANKIDTYSRDPWANYFTERNIVTSRGFGSGNYQSVPSVETFTIPKSYTPRPAGNDFYHLHRWAIDVYDDKNNNAQWDSGGWNPGVTWDRGLDGRNITNDRGEGNGIFDAEPFVDADGDGKHDYDPLGEAFSDRNANGSYEGRGEGYRDSNSNGQYDLGEPFDDVDGNGVYTGVSEPFIDTNGNHVWDAGEPYTDVNGNGRWGFSAEAYTDVNMNGHRDGEFEPYWDMARLNPARWTGAAWSPAASTFVAANGAYDVRFTDSGGIVRFCLGEGYRDLNANGQYDPGEPFDDANGNLVYDGTLEPYTDSNSNGRYDIGEGFEDLNGNRVWGYAVEPYWDRDMDGSHDGTGEGFYDQNSNGTRDTEDYGAEPYVDANHNGHWDAGEAFTDMNGNDAFDTATVSEVYHDRWGASGCETFTDATHDGYFQEFESFSDSNGDCIRNANQVFDGGERFVDVNGNLRYDGEPFTDSNGNGKFDILSPTGESYTDYNHNGRWDPDGAGEPYTDSNGNGQWDATGGPSEPFTDSDHDGVWDSKEVLTYDYNGNGVYDAKKKIGGVWYGPDTYIDGNANGKWDNAEPFTDTNGNGIWDATSSEPYTDSNGNGHYDATGLPEAFVDLNGNGRYDAVLTEPFQDVGFDGLAGTNDFGENNGSYDREPFMDDGVTGVNSGTGTPIVNASWAGNGKCDGDPWIDTNGNRLMDGEPMFDKNRNYRGDARLPFPVADYDVLKAFSKQLGTYYYGDSSGNIRNEQGQTVDFASEWGNKTGFYFVDTTDRTRPRYPKAGDLGNLVDLKFSGSFFTRASIYIGGNVSFTGQGSGQDIRAKNPGELRNDSNGNGSYDAPNGEWTSTDPRGFTVHHASGMETYYDANGNGIYDVGEWFRDYDADGFCDVEEYVDDMVLNGTPDDQLNFTDSQNFRFGPYTSPGSNIKVHLASVIYCAGQFDGGGNCIIYGAVVALNGFAVGGTPDIYYNVDLSFGMGNGLNVNVRPVSWETLNR